MKKVFLFIFLCICLNTSYSQVVTSQSCDIIIRRNAYTLCYNYYYKGPIFASYQVTPEMVSRPPHKTRPSYRIERSVSAFYRGRNTDYAGSGYDRGHLAPNSALDYTDSSRDSLYFLSNITPQDPIVNRYIWSKIENHVRDLATNYIVSVTTGVCYPPLPDRINGVGPAIPTYLFKVVEYGNKTEHYLVENRKQAIGKSYLDYKVTVGEINNYCDQVTIK